MRRTILLAVTAALSMLAFGLPRPPAPEGPQFTGPSAVDLPGAADASVWYCPTMSAGAVRDTWLMLASEASVAAEITLPNPIPNEEPDTSQFTMAGPGAVAVEIASIVRRGDAPGFIEIDDGPSAVAAVMATEGIDTENLAVTGDQCTAAVPKLWHLPGATTRTGRVSTLRLFNPFPEPAKVTVGGSSEFGEIALLGLDAIDIAGRSWTDINLNERVSLLDDIALTVSSEDGLVIPSLVVTSGVDDASWPGTGLSTDWSFPVASTEDLAGFVVVSNPGDAPLSVDIDVHTPDGPLPAAETASVPSGQPLRIPLRDLADGAFGIVVRATAPVAAAVIAEDTAETTAEEDTGDTSEQDRGRIAGTVGVASPATRWLLPGVGGIGGSVSTMWMMNTGTEDAVVAVQPLGALVVEPEEFTVPAGSTRSLEIQSLAVAGYLVSSPTPISASWSVEFGGGVAFVSGTPVGE